MKIAIIGAGASGLALAGLLADRHEVYVFERLDRPGRKLLASGNGRCNMSNLNMNENFYNHKGFVKKLYDDIPKDKVYDFFDKLGILTKADNEGRIYPYSNSSQTVLDALLNKCKNVCFNYNYLVKSIKFNNKWFINDFKPGFDHLFITSGSIAGMEKSKQDGVYSYLDFLKFTKLSPALCGFRLKENVKAISGVRVKALVKLLKNDKEIYAEAGEVIFKDDGISGIVIMNVEEIYLENYEKNANFKISLDFCPDFSLNDLKKYQLEGILPLKLARYLKHFSDTKNLEFNIYLPYDYNNAQVINGGISLDMVNDNLEYINNKTLHFAGEVLDINGRCGGYNLHFAFASALKNFEVLNNENKN